MMRTLFLVLCIGLQLCVHAQELDFPDFRSKKDMFSKMQEKDIRADLATFTMTGIDEGAGKEPLQSIPVTDYGKDFITFSGNDVTVTLRSGPFLADKHKLAYSEEHLIKIDNKGYFGNYGSVPKTTVSAVTLTIAGDTIAIPAAAYTDFCNPVFTYNDAGNGKLKPYGGVYFSGDGKKIYIYLLKKEEGGSYEITWVISNKTYLRRVVDYGFLK
ncbi:hypothetical protein [Deminuibacter soli]|uniref:Uncharacterized protein n=1 Tax=Deminuibacter soli TaxID=2291815 RepID=A0A3E1NDW0_9BACT|nr:hypothetical protein [Deminuibacter soli]RFM26140.1 hypothetical protein DXN05_21290 [Deminuibacter soli]